ncbi:MULTISPECIES: MFS transporter [Streptomyces]|uniref:MFS transporter n=1 Tax=Streptomyces TaxID=1883 RepID=UPI00163BA7BA|nr:MULTISPECIES: MFS transporter [Streptomyces]MBC2876164.1 MFS transporter [Streptomyces sp. TYQ1024]UBI35605.1 MFS transporter [Streptomyces mobaraensis]
MTRVLRNTWVLTSFTSVTNLTDGITKVTLPLMATSLTASPVLLSGVLTALTLPWLLVALHVGVLVDRADRRKLLWAANGMRIATVFCLLVAVGADALTLPMLYLAAVTLGVAEVIALTSAAAIIPDAVPPSERDRANAWVAGAETLCNELAGPFVGGVLAAASVSVALGASAGGYLAGMAVLPLLVGHFKVAHPADAVSSVNREAAEGLRFLWGQRLLRLFAFTVTILVMCWAAWFALMPLVATQEWGLSPTGYGTLVGALGFGGLIGTVAVNTLNRRFGRRRVMFSNVFLTCSMVAIPAVTSNAWAAGVGAFLGGMGGTLWVVNSRVISQTLVGTGMMGRYSAASRLFSWGSLPLGSALAGMLAQTLGHRVSFAIFALATMVVVLPFLRTFTPRTQQELAAVEDAFSGPESGHDARVSEA